MSTHKHDAGTVAGYGYGQESVSMPISKLSGSDLVEAVKDLVDGAIAGPTPGTTLRSPATTPRTKTESSRPGKHPGVPVSHSASEVPLSRPDDLPDVPSVPAKVSHFYATAARKTAYQIYEELNRSRSLEAVVSRGGFSLEDVTRWSKEDDWEGQFQADKAEVEALALQEGNPVQAIKLRASMKVDCLWALERDISCTDAKFGLKQTDRKAIFEMVKELTASELEPGKMRPNKIFILMDKEAYERNKMSRKDQVSTAQDEKLYDDMLAKYRPKGGSNGKNKADQKGVEEGTGNVDQSGVESVDAEGTEGPPEP